MNTVHINTQIGEKVGDKYTVSKDRVEVLKTVHITKMGDKVGDKYTDSKDRVEVLCTKNMTKESSVGSYIAKSAVGSYIAESTEGRSVANKPTMRNTCVKTKNSNTADEDGGEASQIKITSREVLPDGGEPAAHDVWGGHAQQGARPGEGHDQGVGQPQQAMRTFLQTVRRLSLVLGSFRNKSLRVLMSRRLARGGLS